MGLFEDIGNAIGNAVGALADFIGSAFDAVIRGIFDTTAFLGSAMLKNTITEMGGSDTDLKADLEAMMSKHEGDRALGPEKIIDELLDYEGPAESGKGTASLNLLFDMVLGNLHDDEIIANISEFATLGQVEGIRNYLDVGNKAWAMMDLCNKRKMMEYDAAFFLPYQKEVNAKYQNAIPGASDIVRFALREVFDPAQREILLTPRPGGEYYDAMHENGYKDYWSDSYWAAHWELPSISQLSEMLHRGKITPETWEKYVRYNDYLPEMIPRLAEIIYKPYTRVDVRRMYDVGVLTDDELLQSYKDLGYDDEHANNMALWTRVYIAVGELRARYSKGWITKEELKQSFINLGMSEDKAQTYMEKLVKAEAEAAEGKERDLTKTDITRSVAKGLLSREDGISRLIDLGYDEQEATLLIDAVVKKAVAEEITVDRDISKTEIIDGVKLGVISREDSIPMLMKLGYSKDEANYILDLRVLPVHTERIIKERDLTKAEVIKGVKKGILTESQAVTMLMQMGYDEDEAWYIIVINVEASTGSPHTWSEFQNIINLDRKARKQPVKPIPKEIPQLEAKIKRYQTILDKAKSEKKPHKDLVEIEIVLNPLKRELSKKIKEYEK